MPAASVWQHARLERKTEILLKNNTQNITIGACTMKKTQEQESLGGTANGLHSKN